MRGRDKAGYPGLSHHIPPAGIGRDERDIPLKGDIPALSRSHLSRLPRQLTKGNTRMKGPMKTPTREAAADLAAQLKASEYGLMDAVVKGGLKLREAGKLVDMHRKLRSLRYEIEVQAGIW